MIETGGFLLFLRIGYGLWVDFISGAQVYMSEGSRQIFNLEKVYTQIGDHYDQTLSTLRISLLDPSASLDEEMIFRLGLVTAFQYAEGLPDTAAAQATNTRKDWRYALHLPNRHPGLNPPLLCRFRASLYFSTQAVHEFEQLLSSLKETGLFSVQAASACEAEQVLSRVCAITHLTTLKRPIKTALSCLVAADPDWLRANALPHWYERYKTGRQDQPVELSEGEIIKEAVRLGRDIQYLLTTLNALGTSEITNQPEIQVLARLLDSEFIVNGEKLSWRSPRRANCSCAAQGPYRTQ
jgi:hypothetical protein